MPSPLGRVETCEEKVVIIIGSTASPPSPAVAEVAREAETVQLAGAPIELPDGRDAYTFRLPLGISLMAERTIAHTMKSGGRNGAFLGYTDVYGENWRREVNQYAAAAGLKLTAAERFERPDTSVTAQALNGRTYLTYSAVAPDRLRMGGKDVEGTIGLSAPAVAADQLPDSSPSKQAPETMGHSRLSRRSTPIAASGLPTLLTGFGRGLARALVAPRLGVR